MIIPQVSAVSGIEFLSKKFKPREFIIEPFFMTQGLMMIYAQRGIGKTYFAMTLAAAMVKASNLFEDRFKICKKWKVLYIDGEMSGCDMQERLGSFELTEEELSLISVINPDMQEPLGESPNLASEEGQAAIEPFVNQADVIIVDNLSTLARSVSENQSNSWDSVQAWALKLRAKGKSIIFIHHAGKNNTQRGTSRREDVLDTVINLRRPAEYESSQGAKFEIHFEKSRGFTGEDAEGFEIALEVVNGKTTWVCSKLNAKQSAIVEKVLQLDGDGVSQRTIAKEVNISPSTVNRIILNNR